VRRVFSVIRIVAAAFIIAALVAQLQYTWGFYSGVPNYLVKYLSFFTIQSNLLSAIALLIGAWYGFERDDDPHEFSVIRGAVTTYMIVTAGVYYQPFRAITLDQPITLPWANFMLHVVAPAYLLFDWVLAPGRQVIPWRRLWVIMLYPVSWIVLTLVRAPTINWYPYPFFNPKYAEDGYGTVALYIGVIAVFMIAVDAVVVALSRLPTVPS
jgi:hypothetical protein